MDSNWLVATVDVGPFNRTMIVDTLSINQTLISNPRWDSSSPSIGDGKVAFLQVTRDDIISTSQDSLRNNDVYVYYVESSETRQHTFDDDVDQFQPQILLDRLAWIEVNDEGEKQLLVYSFIDTIEPRNSLLLQASILAMIPLIFLWTLQAYGGQDRHSASLNISSRLLEALLIVSSGISTIWSVVGSISACSMSSN